MSSTLARKLYKLSIDYNKIEVPNVWNTQPVLLEAEYYRDAYECLGPPRLSTPPGTLLSRLQVRAKIMYQEISIFTPGIEDHLNAYLNQCKKNSDTGIAIDVYAKWQVRNFIRFLYLD